jgi:hypothetical protein
MTARWSPVAPGPQAETLLRELRLEVGPGHPLFGRLDGAEIVMQDLDDILVRLADGDVAEVHLTWVGQRERDGRWPSTAIHASLAAWQGDTA